MFTNLLLKIKRFPAWLARAKRENPVVYAECLLTMFLPLTVILNFFSFQNDGVYLVLLVAIPGLWVLVLPFLTPGVKNGGGPIGIRAVPVLPILAMTLVDAIGMPMIVFLRRSFGEESYLEFYLLVAATVFRVGLMLITGIRRYRGKVVVDAIAGIISLAFALAIYSLAITA
jgi:hypothetical protein